MLTQLEWRSLESRRRTSRLVNMYKCIRKKNALSLPNYVMVSTKKEDEPIQPSCRIDSMKYSFFPRTIKEWNMLPSQVKSVNEPANFKLQLADADE